jgi:hypothetical protein
MTTKTSETQSRTREGDEKQEDPAQRDAEVTRPRLRTGVRAGANNPLFETV